MGIERSKGVRLVRPLGCVWPVVSPILFLLARKLRHLFSAAFDFPIAVFMRRASGLNPSMLQFNFLSLEIDEEDQRNPFKFLARIT